MFTKGVTAETPVTQHMPNRKIDAQLRMRSTAGVPEDAARKRCRPRSGEQTCPGAGTAKVRDSCVQRHHHGTRFP